MYDPTHTSGRAYISRRVRHALVVMIEQAEMPKRFLDIDRLRYTAGSCEARGILSAKHYEQVMAHAAAREYAESARVCDWVLYRLGFARTRREREVARECQLWLMLDEHRERIRHRVAELKGETRHAKT